MEVSLRTNDKTQVEKWKEGKNLHTHPYNIEVLNEPAQDLHNIGGNAFPVVKSI